MSAGPLRKRARLKDRVAELVIELVDALHRPADGERAGDDGTGRGSADQIEVVGEHRRVVAGVVADELLNPRQELQGENAPDPSAVEGEDTFRSRVRIDARSSLFASFHPPFFFSRAVRALSAACT